MNIEELSYCCAAAVLLGYALLLVRFLAAVPGLLRRIAEALELQLLREIDADDT